MSENLNIVDTVDQPASDAQIEKKRTTPGCILGGIFKGAICLVCIVMTAVLIVNMLGVVSSSTGASVSGISAAAIMDKFDMVMTNEISSALEGVLKIDKVYWLSDQDLVAPEPNPEGFGTADSPAELGWLLEEATELIDGQDMLFSTETQIWDRDKVYYYYDETILAITWKEVIDNCTYTFSEVKIAHPSQFRRFLANGEFGSDKQFTTTEMAASVNAVLTSSGDFYKYRQFGVVVYEGEVKRAEFERVDTCFIDDKGELIMSRRNDFSSIEEAQKFVDDNNIRFSLAFGPVLIENGVECVPRPTSWAN